MSQLDKYFEKARNVEPIYEEDDAKKLLYGKLSDGGIATNLYNKIKVFPMITAIITSVATIATIAFFSLSSPEVRVEQPSKIISQSSNTNAEIDTPKNKPTQTKTSIISLQPVQNELVNKKEVTPKTDENRIDIKSVNSLKLTKDELAKLGIEIIGKNFKVNAFDKYTYTINQNNEKQRDYYNKDEDHDAWPTPAMVTTSTGFKTLTLFKKGNVEATVERYSDIENGYSKQTTNIEQSINADSDIDKTANLFYNPKLRDSLQSAADSSLKNQFLRQVQSNSKMRDLLQRESDSLEVIEIHKESIINLDTSFDDKTVFESSDNIHDLNKRGTSSTIDTIAENEYLIKSDEPIRIKIHNYNPNMKVINSEKFKIIGKDTIYEKDSYISDISQPREFSKEEKERMKKRGTKVYHIENVSSVTINNVTMQDSNIVDIKDNKQNIKTEIEVDEGENNQEFTLKPGQKVWGDEDNDSNNSSSKLYSNMSFDFLEYNINELIPIEISFDGVNTDFIVWYEATEDFLKRLPKNILEKINPELVALTEQNDHCENEPIEKKDAVMDVWSGCSGAIKEMKVFPNPATSNSNVEFELEDSRVISISIYDLSGKLIKNVKTGMSLGKGNTSESLNLTGVNPGLYYVVVKSEKGEQALQRIIIE
ncbi:MAG: hypothetical protein CVV25_03170 [Ignavibacteriae bacterium HGW-Ignavibacteriae-4]|jgi:hypothetical protein|nr:MAG: hypothetical protein CVV25_03170 [Ignavibacteriae bacterium HGW-Ignavibacteriae-4]